MTKIHILPVLLLSASMLQGATYYVSLTGSNASAGTEAAPWATVSYASTNVRPGDTVLVLPGVYSTVGIISGNGTTNSMITYRPSQVGTVTNRGQWVINASHVKVDGFEITGGGNLTSGPDSIYIGMDRTNVHVVNNWFHDADGGWDTAVSADENGWAYNITVSNNIVHHWGAINDAVICPRGWDWIVSNNTISNTFGGDAFRLYGGRHIIRNNTVKEIGSAYVRVYGCSNPAFNGFYFYNAALSAQYEPGAPGIPFAHTNANGYMWFNWADDNSTDGITWADYGWSNKVSICSPNRSITYASAPSCISPASEWTMHHPLIGSVPGGNVGYVNHPDFLQIFGSTVSTNHLIIGNYVQANTVAAISQLACQTLEWPPPISDWTFANNIFVGVRGASANIKTKWYHNLFFYCGGDASAIGMTTYSTNSSDYRGNAQGSEVKGNIFIGGAPDQSGGTEGKYNSGWYGYSNYGEEADNVYTNCNWNYVTRGTNWAAVRQPNSNYPPGDFAWYEPNGINGGDPGLPFIRLAAFNAVASSKLIDKATPIPGLTTDFEGKSRNMGAAPDIGPFEFDPDLVAWWPFEEITSNQLSDWTGNGHTAYSGNPTNWITSTVGPRGKAGVWSQVGVMTNAPPQTYVLSQYAYVTNLAGLEFITNGAISLWVQWGQYISDSAGATRHGTLLDSGGTTIQFATPSSMATNSWRLAYGPASSSFPAVGPTFSRYSTSANFPSNMVQFTHARDALTWHHIVMTWDANGTVVGYQNGAPFTTNAFPVPYLRIAGRDPANPPFGASEAIPWMSIGAASHGGSLTWGDDKYPNDGYFVGKMDDIRVYKRKLTRSDVASLYSGAPTVTLSDVVQPPPPIGQPLPPIGLRVQ